MRPVLGKIIRSCRLYCGFTQEYIAHKLTVTVHTYANIENGRVDITVSKLVRIAGLFGLEAHQVLSLAEEIVAHGDDNFSSEVIKGMIRITDVNPHKAQSKISDKLVDNSSCYPEVSTPPFELSTLHDYTSKTC